MKKGEILTGILVESMAAEGKCLSRLEDGRVLFIEGAAPGDVADIQLFKIKSNFVEGKAIAITKFSEFREAPFCEHFGLCGGCKWQHLSYAKQLQYKQQQVIDNLERIGGLSVATIKPIIPSHKTKYYRNKLDYTFSHQRWLTKEELEDKKSRTENLTGDLAPSPFGEGVGGEVAPALGYHLPSHFDKVFDVKECYLQPDPSNAIRLLVKDVAVKNNISFFDLRKQTGYLRTLTIRMATTAEVMVIVQVANDEPAWLEKILSAIATGFPQVTSLLYVINTKRNDTFHDLDIVCWKGNPYITEQMNRPAVASAKAGKPDGSGVLNFRVGPKSFYQTNSEQAYTLYEVAWKMADLKGDELVYDLYTGTGTIASFVSGQAKKVIGLEYVKSAIDDAKVNAQLNGITNTDFFAGDIKDLLDDNFLQEHGRPDVVITDPPRNGMHEDVCRMLLKAAPKKVVYVSCNPATQARDLKILCEQYDLVDIQPVDMFPHTMHVENVVSLKLRASSY
jgi:23S rRNA (uracil1939-C5)-methyltransferase